jgi:hypothetical protein
MKTITAQSHINQAQEYTDKGNFPTQAKNSTKEADKVLAEIELLMQKNNTLPTATTGNSSQDMAIAFGDLRWLPWLVLALIIDLCPVIAILELRRLGAAKVAPDESDTDTTLTSGTGTTIEANDHLKKLLADNRMSGHFELLGDITTQHKQFTAIVAALKSGSIKPGKNAIQKEFNLGTATVDQIFEQLTQLNVIKRTEGKRTYELINDDTTTHQTVARAT